MAGGTYGSSASGLQCAWGSDLDMRIPRQKLPKCALPPDVRANMKLGTRENRGKQDKAEDGLAYAAGGGVLQPRESANGEYRAGCQKQRASRQGCRRSVAAMERCRRSAAARQCGSRSIKIPRSGRARRRASSRRRCAARRSTAKGA
jgi:hypothetical protein